MSHILDMRSKVPAYTINLSFKVEDPAEKLTILEKSCWHDAGCIWSTWEDCHVLEMDDSGTSGMLRLMTADGVRFAVIVGVHRHKPWCDILVDLKRDDTLMKLHQTYYGSGWRTAEWQQLSSVTKETIAGKTLNINFYGTDGRQLHAYLNYGQIPMKMSTYTFGVSILMKPHFPIVEESCWHCANGCTWAPQSTGLEVKRLTMGGNDTSGMLRLMAPDGSYLALIIGVHDDEPWCDLLVNLKRDDTLTKLHPTYYGSDSRANEFREIRRIKKKIATRVVTLGCHESRSKDFYAELRCY